MEKNRARRYETANGLALDVQRFLADEAVSARPPSKLYKFQRLARRHRLLFVSLGAIMTLLVASLIAVSASLAHERQSQREAKQVKQFLENMLQVLDLTLPWAGIRPSCARFWTKPPQRLAAS